MTDKTITSPLEDIFDIEAGTTERALQIVPASTEMTAIDDAEEEQIATQLSTVYSYALDAFEQQTANVQTIGDVPKQLMPPYPDMIEIRGEIYMSKKSLEKVNLERIKNGQEIKQRESGSRIS
jgi:hypothetical protein